MFKRYWILFDTGEGGSGGGAGSGGSDPLNLAKREAIEYRDKYNALKTQFDELNDKHVKLEGSYKTLETTHGETSAKLGQYTAKDAWGKKLKDLQDHKDFKGKVAVDETKAMEYLARGSFNQETLEADVRKAIEFAGTPVKPTTSSLPSGGAGSDAGAGREKATSDPIGNFVRSSGASL